MDVEGARRDCLITSVSLIILILSLTLLCSVEAGTKEGSVESDSNVNIVEAEELIEPTRHDADALLIDTRVVVDRQSGYIEGFNQPAFVSSGL